MTNEPGPLPTGRRCCWCVMDESDEDISFDAAGRCNHCRAYELEAIPLLQAAQAHVEDVVTAIKERGRSRRYDCILGISGGVDSSFTALRATELGLRPLVVHLDNGWNTELAIQNVQQVVQCLGLDLYTHVVDWAEFRDIQRAFLRASVIDIEMITDHAITAVVHDVARQERVATILSGGNYVTEWIMPKSWVHRKSDLRNLRAIHKTYGTRPLKTLPTASTLRLRFLSLTKKLRHVRLLDHLEYSRDLAIARLESELGWRNYGGKHHESFFTRFYQNHVLPEKFGVDKRKPHLSTQICSGQLSRAEALQALQLPLYEPAQLNADREYVLKKLGLTDDEFEHLMALPPRSHYDFPSDEDYLRVLRSARRRLSRPGPG